MNPSHAAVRSERGIVPAVRAAWQRPSSHKRCDRFIGSYRQVNGESFASLDSDEVRRPMALTSGAVSAMGSQAVDQVVFGASDGTELRSRGSSPTRWLWWRAHRQ